MQSEWRNLVTLPRATLAIDPTLRRRHATSLGHSLAVLRFRCLRQAIYASGIKPVDAIHISRCADATVLPITVSWHVLEVAGRSAAAGSHHADRAMFRRDPRRWPQVAGFPRWQCRKFLNRLTGTCRNSAGPARGIKLHYCFERLFVAHRPAAAFHQCVMRRHRLCGQLPSISSAACIVTAQAAGYLIVRGRARVQLNKLAT